MTDYRVYVGEVIDAALSWDELGDGWERNVRHIATLAHGSEALLAIARKIDEKKLRGQKVDWGAWVAEVSKEELLRMYPPDQPPKLDPAVYRPFFGGASDDEIIERMNLVPGRNLEGLAENGNYVLVAIEGV